MMDGRLQQVQTCFTELDVVISAVGGRGFSHWLPQPVRLWEGVMIGVAGPDREPTKKAIH